jgi:broad specificity phosphatase PhoE
VLADHSQLTSREIEQTKIVDDFLKDQGIAFCKVYVSPLSRAVNTLTNATRLLGKEFHPPKISRICVKSLQMAGIAER